MGQVSHRNRCASGLPDFPSLLCRSGGWMIENVVTMTKMPNRLLLVFLFRNRV
jgi:hypothetical protein